MSSLDDWGLALPRLGSPMNRANSEAIFQELSKTEIGRMGREGTGVELSWQAAFLANVKDADGNVLVDLTGGFGVALFGHRNPLIVTSIKDKLDRLMVASGDLWPDVGKVQFIRSLSPLLPDELCVCGFGLSGSDALEIAVKSALLYAPDRPQIVVFENGYHGLSLGMTNLQNYKKTFRAPFSNYYARNARVLRYGCSRSTLKAALTPNVGCVIVEPIQVRGGLNFPPDGWLADVKACCEHAGVLLIVDEVYTGIGRTGMMLRSQQEEIVPDIVCLGKALGGGLPISVCVGKKHIMEIWSATAEQEVLHTQTFQGHPLSLASATAVTEQLLCKPFFLEVNRQGRLLAEQSEGLRGVVTQQAGLLIGMTFESPIAFAVERLLIERGYLTLTAGAHGNCLMLSPPACLTGEVIAGFGQALRESLAQVK